MVLDRLSELILNVFRLDNYNPPPINCQVLYLQVPINPSGIRVVNYGSESVLLSTHSSATLSNRPELLTVRRHNTDNPQCALYPTADKSVFPGCWKPAPLMKLLVPRRIGPIFAE